MSKVLVAYFSASGTTKRLAEELADNIGADSFEIVPEVKYERGDLNWNDPKSRSSVEMDDPNSRPAIASILENVADYDTVFVGFPVWWYQEPRIIDTFMESYDFSGKTVIPFATSGMSPIGPSGANMQKLAPGAKVEAGQRFSSRDGNSLTDWAKNWL